MSEDYRPPQYGDAQQFGDEYKPPYDAPTEKKGMSGCAKAFLIIGGLGIVSLLVCCVGGFFFMRSMTKRDPVEVQAIGNQIVDWDFNDEIKGVAGLEFFSLFRMAIFTEPEKGFLMVVDSSMGGPDDVGKQMQGQFKGGGGNDAGIEETEVYEEGTREVEIKGEKINLQFDKSRGKDSGNEYFEVISIVPGKVHPVFIILKVRADVYSEEDVLDRFRNIK